MDQIKLKKDIEKTELMIAFIQEKMIIDFEYALSTVEDNPDFSKYTPYFNELHKVLFNLNKQLTV